MKGRRQKVSKVINKKEVVVVIEIEKSTTKTDKNSALWGVVLKNIDWYSMGYFGFKD